MSEGIKYIKVAKVDGNGTNNTNALQSLTKLTIPYSSGNITYDILNISEERDYFLYFVNGPSGSFNDAGNIKYDFTGSLDDTPAFIGFNENTIIIPITSITDNLNFLTDSNSIPSLSHIHGGSSYYTQTYPQKNINILATGSIKCSLSAGGSARLFLNRNSTVLAQTSLFAHNTTTPFKLTSSISEVLPGDAIYLSTTTGDPTFNNILFPAVSYIYISSSINSGSQLETIPEPFFTADFSRALECQPLLNNVTRERSNPFLQDLDYQTSQTVPTNITSVISGSATRATVPESYYTSLAQTNIRYNGVKNQSEKINEWTLKSSYTDFSQSFNIGTYGKTSPVESLDTNIYEYKWGGGTTPEILGWGALKLGGIINVQTTNSVSYINPSDGFEIKDSLYRSGYSVETATNYRKVGSISPPFSVATSSVSQSGTTVEHFWHVSQSVSDFYYSLNRNNPVNTDISLYSYPSSTNRGSLPKTSKIVTTEWGVPSISNYGLTSSLNRGAGSNAYGTLVGTELALSRSVHISNLRTDSNGYYTSTNPVKPNWSTLGDQINESLNRGGRWFITVYNEFEFPDGQGGWGSVLTTGSALSPYNRGYSSSDAYGDYPNPLGSKGVYEVVGTLDGARFGAGEIYQKFYLLLDKPVNLPTSAGIQVGGGEPGNSLGVLIWEAIAVGENNYVVVQDEINAAGPGCFINKFTPKYVSQNLKLLTENFGINKQ